MIGKRFIDGDKLLEQLDPAQYGLDASRVRDRVLRWVKRQPRSPQIVSRQGAADILGISSEHMSRYKDRLPEPIKVEGSSWPVYLKADITALAKELRAERAKRNGRKEKVSR